jgi:hypothetical protein
MTAERRALIDEKGMTVRPLSLPMWRCFVMSLNDEERTYAAKTYDIAEFEELLNQAKREQTA